MQNTTTSLADRVSPLGEPPIDPHQESFAPRPQARCIQIMPPLSTENPYYEAARQYIGAIKPSDYDGICADLTSQYGLAIPSLKIFQQVAQPLAAAGMTGVIGVGSGHAYVESRFSKWFGFDALATDLEPREPDSRFGLRVLRMGAREAAILDPRYALLMSFPMPSFSASAFKAYHDAGGKFVIYIDSAGKLMKNQALNTALRATGKQLINMPLPTFIPIERRQTRQAVTSALRSGKFPPNCPDPRDKIALWKLR